MRREIINQLNGKDGQYTTDFGPATIERLENMGIIKFLGSSEVQYPHDLVIEVRSYAKA
jgi:hypothetical protein